MNPGDLLRIARHLAAGSIGSGRGRPRQTDLCRAVSAAYYAMFHALAQCCADLLAGTSPAHRNPEAWRQTYRALEHGLARSQCSNQAAMRRFPPEIRQFAEVFVTMQRGRQEADYDPVMTFSRSQVIGFIDQVSETIAGFNAADRGQRRAFSLYVLFRRRP